jgi:hypothetical protein
VSWTKWSKWLAPSTGAAQGQAWEPFPNYIARVNPRFHIYQHNRAINEALEACTAGEILNLMVWLPPGTPEPIYLVRIPIVRQ